MYIDSSSIKRNQKVYTRHLLRSSFRENGKVKHKTIANLSGCSEDEISALKLALKHKNNLAALGPITDIETVLGKRVGAVWMLYALADRLGISKALGSDEDALYQNLAWLAEQQEDIEKKLFSERYPDVIPTLFLYDVTSSYLEGTCNELADWGYGRDKKRGKMQIVVGLLAGPDGLPVAVRVFRGNTNDTKTVSEQVRILAQTFGVKEVTLVGDRGMLKGPQIDQLPEDFRYITAITKPQILKMLEDRVIQYELFTDKVCEVEYNGARYVLRRNPIRAEEMAMTRESKRASVERLSQDLTRYLAEHGKASVDVALKKATAKIQKLKAGKWLRVIAGQRAITVETDEAALLQEALLDGCYVIKSDVSKDNADAETLHERYCDLENVERAFRTMKTTHLEMRPVFVRKEQSTRGHAFVVMLALLLQRELEECWADMDITVQEGIDELAAIHVEEIKMGEATIRKIPTPNEIGKQLLEKTGVDLPLVLPARTANVHTKKKLPSERLK
jgi:transposase